MSYPAMDFSYQRREALFRTIRSTLERMPSDLREAFVLSHYEHLPPAEIARRMRVVPSELTDLLKRANRIFYRDLRKK